MTRDDLLARLPEGTEQGRRVREALAQIDRDHQRERERLLALFDEAPVFLVLLEGPELRCTRVNRLVREGGPSPLGKLAREIYPGMSALVEALERVFHTGVPETVRGLPAYYPDGSDTHRFFTRCLTPLRDGGGAVYAVLSALYDVTDEVRSQDAHRAAEKHSQQELQRLSALLEEAPVLITVLEGPELLVRMVNRLARALHPGRDFLGRSLRDAIPADSPMLRAALRVYETGAAETFEATSPRLAGLEGRSFTTTVVPVHDGNGPSNRVMTVTLEITEQRRTQEALTAQAEALELARRQAVEASLAKDEFLARLGHELRNPLAPIVTTLELMRLEGKPSADVDLLERQVHHLVRLVDDLLDVSRIARGMVELQQHDVPLPTIVARALEMAHPLLEQRRQRITSDLGPATVHGDSDRLAQVVANLITNASKYSEVGSPIRIATDQQDGRARIVVADEGAGIAPEMLGQVFDAFVQQRQTLARSAGGLGLGLAIVKGLVEAHGGTVAAHSEGLGKGSRFVIELPAVELQRIAVGHARLAVRARALAQRRRVLVVDDNRDAALALKRALEALGQTVAVAHDGPSALEEARRFGPQVGLLDIGLPGMDGYQLAAALRADHELHLCAISGYGEARDHHRSRAAGFEEHLVKPVDLGRLAGLLERLAGYGSDTVRG